MGVLIFEGMRVGILPGDFQITVNEDGSTSSNAILSTSYNVLPIWIKIAKSNLSLAKAASQRIKDEWNENSDFQKELLVNELVPSVQVILSCGIAIDALYDILKSHSGITKEEREIWKAKRTKRAFQISETIRRVYRASNDLSARLRQNIAAVMDFRDKAVHPDSSLQRSCIRPDINVGVDWRFSAYRFSNADSCYRSTLEMIIHLYDLKSNNQSVDQEMENIVKALLELKLINRKEPENSVDGVDSKSENQN